MRKYVPAVIGMGLVLLLFTASCAEAGVIGKVTSALSGEVVALIVSALVAVFAGVNGVVFVKVTKTFRAAGEFLSTLGSALEDHRITREELSSIIRDGEDIFTAWK
jgi:Mg2+/Co2+ transporter CorB